MKTAAFYPAKSRCEQFESIVLSSRDGVNAATLVKKTGFDDRKIHFPVARLKKLGRIATKGWGRYGKP